MLTPFFFLFKTRGEENERKIGNRKTFVATLTRFGGVLFLSLPFRPSPLLLPYQCLTSYLPSFISLSFFVNGRAGLVERELPSAGITAKPAERKIKQKRGQAYPGKSLADVTEEILYNWLSFKRIREKKRKNPGEYGIDALYLVGQNSGQDIT